MGKHKSPRTVSPHAVATISSVLLLIVSVGLGFYFTELRGPGVSALLASNQASELLVLIGGLAAVILTGHLAVANGARSAQGASAYRKLVRHASEVDYSDPQAASEFDGVPELRDLVSVLVSEKQQGQELLDALESVRGENHGLLTGMERSLESLGKIREDHPSEHGQKVATLWNSLLERVATKEPGVSAPQADALQGIDLPGGPTKALLGASGVEQRLLELEERVQQLQSSLVSTNAPLVVTEEEPSEPASSPLLVSEDEPIALLSDPVPVTTPEVATPIVNPVADSDVVSLEVPQEQPVLEPTLSVPWQDTAPKYKSEPVGVAEVSDNSEVENNFSEWSGAGFGALTEEPESPAVGFGQAPQPFQSAEPVVPEQEELAGLQLPKFTPQKAQDPVDHVEVTYGKDEPSELPEDALLVDAPQEAITDELPVVEFEEEVVDLTSLGAVEYKE